VLVRHAVTAAARALAGALGRGEALCSPALRARTTAAPLRVTELHAHGARWTVSSVNASAAR